MEMVRHNRVDLTPLITHRFSLREIGDAYKTFEERTGGAIKVVIKP
jgi:L-iditol 2-dehydrogenase